MKRGPIIRGVLILALMPVAAMGGVLYSVAFNTSGLIGHSAAPFYIEFQFNDGLGTGDGNNTAMLFNFNFSGGSPMGTPMLLGGASGDLTSGVSITDSDFFNQFVQQFDPGPQLSFNINLTTNVDPGPQPDELSFAILDCTFTAIPTTGPADALLAVDVNSQSPPLRTFSGDTSRSPACGGGPISIGAVPEPDCVALAALSLLMPAGRRILRKKLLHKA